MSRPFFPSDERCGSLFTSLSCRSEKSPLKTPALRQFQIRRHRITGLHFALFGMGIIVIKALCLRTRQTKHIRCAEFLHELPDALERIAKT